MILYESCERRVLSCEKERVVLPPHYPSFLFAKENLAPLNTNSLDDTRCPTGGFERQWPLRLFKNKALFFLQYYLARKLNYILEIKTGNLF
jgi:hypothetical protein